MNRDSEPRLQRGTLPRQAAAQIQHGMQVIDVLGTPLAITNYADLTKECQRLTRAGGTWTIDLTNTHIVTLRRSDSNFRQLTSAFDYFIPDGMPLIWALNRRGAQLTDRVYGPKFMRYCIAQSPASFTHYLLGGSAECLAALQQRLTNELPTLKIVGARNGYFRREEEGDILREINQLSPDFVWIGLGTPKQQEWVHRHKAQIARGVLLAVGFAFDVNAGTKRDAPEWMQRLGLTWLFRLLSEPRRLTSRYLRYNSLFLYYLLRERIAGAARSR